MWAENAKYNNHFLQKQFKHLKPQKINEIVNKEVKTFQRGNIHCDTAHHLKEPCKSSSYFEDRAELAYGNYTLPKLMYEMACNDRLIHFKAVTSLADYVRNPIHAQRAISHFDIVARCQNVFLRLTRNFLEFDYREMENLLDIFMYLAMHNKGAHKIVNRFRLMTQFYEMIRDRDVYMEKVANVLQFLSEAFKRAMYLIDDFKVFDHLEAILKRDICVPYYPEGFWLHLSHILEVDPKEAVNRGFFEILHTRIKGRLDRYHHWEMKCFGLLLDCAEGQQRFVDIDGVKEIYAILTDDDHKLDTYEHVMFTLMNGLMAKAILWRCREFTDLPLYITKLAKEKENRNQQLHCLQSLREMGEMPCIKRFITENCLDDLKKIECDTLDMEKERNAIVYWLEREIYHTTDL